MREKVLVVDDSEAMLHAVARLMKHSGYEVFQANSGQECLKIVAEKLPDLILLDVQLPDIDGYEVVKRLKSDTATTDIFIVHLSAERTDAADQAIGLEGGADGYISQPIDNVELVARVRAFLRHKKTMDELRASEARYRHLFENHPQPMWIVDQKETRFLAVNDSAVKHYGYSRGEFLHLSPRQLVARAKIKEESPTLSAFDLHQKHRRKDGSIIEVDLSRHPIRWMASEAIAVAIADVTAWKHFEREQKRLLEQYEREIRVLGRISKTRPSQAGAQPLQEASADVFHGLQEEYEGILQQALDQKIYKVNHDVARGLRAIADRLFALRASPRDVIDLHCLALKRLAPNPNMPLTQGYMEIGRLTVVELMGNLVSAYREYTGKSATHAD